jgi:hypothetical protein
MNEIVPTKTELAETLIGELNALHLTACALDERIRQEFAEKLTVCQQIAGLLDSARTAIPKAQFTAFVRRLNFTQPVLRAYETISHRAQKHGETRLGWMDMASFERARERAAELRITKPPVRLHDLKSTFFAEMSRALQKALIC